MRSCYSGVQAIIVSILTTSAISQAPMLSDGKDEAYCD